MTTTNFRGKIVTQTRFAIAFLILIAFMAANGHGEKKDIPGIADYEKTDPFDEKALDFLDLDYAKLRLQAGQFAREKKYFEAAQCYLALLKLNLNDSTTIYNLACCYGRLRQAGLAVKSLLMAVRAGFRNYALLKSDPDFVPVRDTPEFISLLERVAVWEESIGETVYVKTSTLSELLIKAPQKIDPASPYRLLIGLHGNGDNSENMLAVLANTLKKEALILAAPQGTYANFPLLRGQHFSWEIQTPNRRLWKIADPLAVENLAQAVQAVKEKYPISEVYLLGFSQGAAYAFLASFKYPGLAAGVISVGGIFPETDSEFSILKEAEIANGKKFRVFIAQGNNDRMIPLGLGAKTTERLKNHGYEVEYLEYEGGHEISPELLKKISTWMAKQ